MLGALVFALTVYGAAGKGGHVQHATVSFPVGLGMGPQANLHSTVSTVLHTDIYSCTPETSLVLVPQAYCHSDWSLCQPHSQDWYGNVTIGLHASAFSSSSTHTVTEI